MGNTTLLFVGYGFSRKGPYFVFDQLDTQKRVVLSILSKTMSLELLDERFCIGTYDLVSFETKPCIQQSKLPLKGKNYCKYCNQINGFNPAFYNTNKISPQQQRYNNQPHVVYMAYFSNSCVKVGIASKKRHLTRLLEQGARAAIILDEFPNASLARQLEAKLCSNEKINEVVSSERKLRLITESNYSFDDAKKVLNYYCEHYYRRKPLSDIINLQSFYFPADASPPTVSSLENQKDAMISGKIIGMVGDIVFIEHNSSFVYAISIKKYVSHLVRYYPNESVFSYSLPPKQYTIWDLMQ